MATIFTRIIRGEIPCHKVTENESHIAFLDINPVAKGHTLVVPKREIDYIFDLPDDLLISTTLFAKHVAGAIDRSLKPIRTGIIVEGLEVPHAHIHLIPIYSDTQNFSLSNKIEITDEEMKEIAASISAEVTQ